MWGILKGVMGLLSQGTAYIWLLVDDGLLINYGGGLLVDYGLGVDWLRLHIHPRRKVKNSKLGAYPAGLAQFQEKAWEWLPVNIRI